MPERLAHDLDFIGKITKRGSAVWLTLNGRSVTDKILAILFPITTFVASGFEHPIANMYSSPRACS